jgi:hypothetical protein
MPPTWFLIVLAFCAGWVANTSIRIFTGQEVFIGGQKAKRPATAVALAIILVAFALIAAINLGFIQDHAP